MDVSDKPLENCEVLKGERIREKNSAREPLVTVCFTEFFLDFDAFLSDLLLAGPKTEKLMGPWCVHLVVGGGKCRTSTMNPANR